MFNGMYSGEGGQPAFGYGMEGQANYGQEQDPYSVSYYQAAAAQYQRSIGWEEQQNGTSASSTWNNQQKPATSASPSSTNYYQQGQQPEATQADNFEATASQQQNIEKPITGKLSSCLNRKFQKFENLCFIFRKSKRGKTRTTTNQWCHTDPLGSA